jgi:ABC-type multidrug transport system ATPase subunit
MRQRLGIAQALIGQPQLIIVDEPTAGLDPEERIRFHNLLAETAGADALIILSTHIVSDVSSLCSRMAIIRRGEILATTAPRQALNELAGCVWEANVEPQQVRALKAKMKIVSSQMSDGSATVRVISSERPTESFQSVAPTLEDYYLNLVREF